MSVLDMGVFATLLLLGPFDTEVIRILDSVPVRVEAIDTLQRLFR